jgi:hypothetical protein
MSNKIGGAGNKKEDGIPLLKCFGNIWIKKLKNKIKELLKHEDKTRVYKPRKINKKRNIQPKYEDNFNFVYEDINLSYEPTNILSVYESDYWRWRRVKEYYKEIEDIDWDRRFKEAKEFMKN